MVLSWAVVHEVRNVIAGDASADIVNRGGDHSVNNVGTALGADTDLDYVSKPAGAGVASDMRQITQFQSQSFILRIIEANGDIMTPLANKNAKWK